MSDSTVILYDLPSKGHCACWSYNPWKTRLALNYKNIPYVTEWVEYPDIAAQHKAAGIGPNVEGMPYTIPAVKLPSGRYMQNSRAIATELEALQPSPPLHLDSPVVAKLTDSIMPRIVSAAAPIILVRILRDVLNPRSAEYFYETRKKRFGMPLDQLEKEKGGERAWKELEGPLAEVASLLKEDSSGPFFMGKEVSYADFVFLSALQFFRRGGQDIFDRVVATDVAFASLYGASTKWLSRDDH